MTLIDWWQTMKVKYSKLKKPSNQDCLRYCAEHKNCQRTECGKRKLIKNDKIIMGIKGICDYLDNKMNYNDWYGDRECMLNNDVFTRRKLSR